MSKLTDATAIIENLVKIGELGIDIADIVIRPEG